MGTSRAIYTASDFQNDSHRMEKENDITLSLLTSYVVFEFGMLFIPSELT